MFLVKEFLFFDVTLLYYKSLSTLILCHTAAPPVSLHHRPDSVCVGHWRWEEPAAVHRPQWLSQFCQVPPVKRSHPHLQRGPHSPHLAGGHHPRPAGETDLLLYQQVVACKCFTSFFIFVTQLSIKVASWQFHTAYIDTSSYYSIKFYDNQSETVISFQVPYIAAYKLSFRFFFLWSKLGVNLWGRYKMATGTYISISNRLGMNAGREISTRGSSDGRLKYLLWATSLSGKAWEQAELDQGLGDLGWEREECVPPCQTLSPVMHSANIDEYMTKIQ